MGITLNVTRPCGTKHSWLAHVWVTAPLSLYGLVRRWGWSPACRIMSLLVMTLRTSVRCRMVWGHVFESQHFSMQPRLVSLELEMLKISSLSSWGRDCVKAGAKQKGSYKSRKAAAGLSRQKVMLFINKTIYIYILYLWIKTKLRNHNSC